MCHRPRGRLHFIEHPNEAFSFFINSIIASSSAKELFPDNEFLENAFRHSLWQALLTQSFGFQQAIFFGELHGDQDQYDDEPDSRADYHNNIIGRKVALQNMDAKTIELKLIILQKLANGELKMTKKVDKNVINTKLDPKTYKKLKDKIQGK